MKKVLSIILLFFGGGGVLCSGEVAIVTVPKSGTHLIQKLLKLVDEKRSYPVYHTDEFYTSEELKHRYSKRVLLVRDPRDVCLSWVRYVSSGQADQVDLTIRNLPDHIKEHWRNLDSVVIRLTLL
ncbi:MAG: hypothetical protein KDK76_01900 [Chlamydiia bacterium]|nr:hypothetical protein [Chlamydiia bacterium]